MFMSLRECLGTRHLLDRDFNVNGRWPCPLRPTGAPGPGGAGQCPQSDTSLYALSLGEAATTDCRARTVSEPSEEQFSSNEENQRVPSSIDWHTGMSSKLLNALSGMFSSVAILFEFSHRKKLDK